MQLGLAVLVVPLLVASTLLVVLLAAAAAQRIRLTRQDLRLLTGRLERQRAEITPWFGQARQRLLAAEAVLESARRALARLDGAVAGGNSRLSEARTSIRPASTAVLPARSHRRPRG